MTLELQNHFTSLNLSPGKTTFIKVKIKPNAKYNQIHGLMSDQKTLKISLKAKPEKNAANISLLKFLSKKFNLPIANLKIQTGSTSTQKTIAITIPKTTNHPAK